MVAPGTTPAPSMPVSTQTTPPPCLPGQHTDNPTSIHARSVHRPLQLHPCQISTQTTQPPSIHARSAHRHPHLQPCQVSTKPPQLHPCQVSTQIITHPSMPHQYTDHPTCIHARSAHTLFMMPSLLVPYRARVLNLFSVSDIPFVHISSQPICIAPSIFLSPLHLSTCSQEVLHLFHH